MATGVLAFLICVHMILADGFRKVIFCLLILFKWNEPNFGVLGIWGFDQMTFSCCYCDKIIILMSSNSSQWQNLCGFPLPVILLLSNSVSVELLSLWSSFPVHLIIISSVCLSRCLVQSTSAQQSVCFQSDITSISLPAVWTLNCCS